jgi:acetaldehyde/propanal dehydrogenase
VGGAKRGKAIIILNPAEPPLIMRDTVHCLTEGTPDEARITASVHAMIREVRNTSRATGSEQAGVRRQARVDLPRGRGLGDYLPKYAGNLDIRTAAALRTGEMIAEEIAAGRFVPQPTAA